MPPARLVPVLLSALALLVGVACSREDTGGSAVVAATAPAWLELRLGGRGSTAQQGVDAYSFSARNLAIYDSQVFAAGKPYFNVAFVPTGAPVAEGAAEEQSGLGPTFNTTSCLSCHVGHGSGHAPELDGPAEDGLLVRLTGPGTDPTGAPLGDAAYGTQLQIQAVDGVPAEGRAEVTYEVLVGSYADGSPYELRVPSYTLTDLAFGPMTEQVVASARLAPPVIGLGLLDSVPEATIVAGADPDDVNGDGISGRANRVWDVARERDVLGRFGWKAGQPSVEQQTAQAALGDLGISSMILPHQNCPTVQVACAAQPTAATGTGEEAGAELDREGLYDLTFYTRLLAVPMARDVQDPQVQRGAAQFERLGCTGCHTPTLQTGDVTLSALADQTIHPFTDLLLHDMGAGLADRSPSGGASEPVEFVATSSEWRTPPLWGLGLRAVVGGRAYYLHDGRAKTVAEAILWHGGEGQPARDAFIALPADQRGDLLAFLAAI